MSQIIVILSKTESSLTFRVVVGEKVLSCICCSGNYMMEAVRFATVQVSITQCMNSIKFNTKFFTRLRDNTSLELGISECFLVYPMHDVEIRLDI